MPEVVDLESLREWMAAHTADIDSNPAAWCAVELALLDLIGKSTGQTVESLLSLPALAGPFRYTAVLGDSSEATFTATAQGYRRMGFTDFKVKLSGDLQRDARKLAILDGLDSSLRVRVDANNLWPDAGGRDRVPWKPGAIPGCGGGATRRAPEYKTALLECRQRSVAQSSLTRASCRLTSSVFSRGAPDRWVVNVRVSKMGGLLRSLEVVSASRARGIPIVVGAQVGETSVLTRAALTVAQAAGADLFAQEGAFGTFLLEHDVCEPSLMFGVGGMLDPQTYPSLDTPGLGLRIKRDA